jgi:DNA-binding NarL/FixJ family response regulator
MSKTRIVLVDDHPIVRDGIKALLVGHEEYFLAGEAADGRELLEKLPYLSPDLVILDISLPKMSGIEITKILSEQYPEIKVLILSMHTGEDFIFNAIKSGARGYLPKNTTRKELIDAINSLIAGEVYFNESISNTILKSYIRKAQNQEEPGEEETNVLSPREAEILKMVAEGFTNQEISDKLFISIRTVESHKNHIMHKLKLRTTVDLVKFAIRKGIIEI